MRKTGPESPRALRRAVGLPLIGDDYVLEYRIFDAGKNTWYNNWNGGKGEPNFMLDPSAKGGRMALTDDY